MLRAGAASIVITNELGTVIQGATVGGTAKFIRDELEANALYLNDGAEQAVLFVSCDLGGIEPDANLSMRESIAESVGVDARQVIIGATHTGGPSVIPSNYLKPVDHKYLKVLQDKLVSLAQEAVGKAQDAQLGWARGRAALGYNRRCCWADGSHSMGGSKGWAHFCGNEGPEDPEQLALFLADKSGKLLAVLHQNTSHPCTFYGVDFYSADYPGYARKILREALGDLPVLFFNGAFGDIGQSRMPPANRHETRETVLRRCGALLAGETLRLLHETSFVKDARLRHSWSDLEADVRLPSAERLAWAADILQKVDAGEKVAPFDIVFAHGASLLQERFGEHPREKLPIHVVRIGEATLVTQPTELFCQFGLDIKRRSPYALTAVFSICDGYRGYCPTYGAAVSGGYSGTPIYWTRFTPETGYRIVDEACRLLHELTQE
ncbi:MAG: hypothetical protein KAI66_04140 [Lentisphaeria bacterium]|nr:hypothetical protein [Lentisphaeria bacterium]